MTRRLRVVPPPAEPCQQHHEYGPSDVLAWNAWALERQKTHTVEPCPDCGLYVIWLRRRAPVPATPEPGLFPAAEPTTPETETP